MEKLFYAFILILHSHPYPSLLGASLVSSLFLLGLGNDVALPVTLSYTAVWIGMQSSKINLEIQSCWSFSQ